MINTMRNGYEGKFVAPSNLLTHELKLQKNASVNMRKFSFVSVDTVRYTQLGASLASVLQRKFARIMKTAMVQIFEEAVILKSDRDLRKELTVSDCPQTLQTAFNKISSQRKH
jgi:hypothetical protein